MKDLALGGEHVVRLEIEIELAQPGLDVPEHAPGIHRPEHALRTQRAHGLEERRRDGRDGAVLDERAVEIRADESDGCFHGRRS
jgi:hypothetical protein